jgi:type IV pilus assembly protein PilP
MIMNHEGGKKIYVIYMLCILFVLCIVGCDQLPIPGGKGGKEQKAAPKPPPQVAPQTATPSPTAQPTQEVERDYVYDPLGKRDPFQPFIAAQTPVKPAGEEIPVTPLQKYDLSQLKLVAIIIGTAEGSAMVEDSEGKGYIIKKGVYVGTNYGKVKAVLKDRVIIEERYRDYTGQVKGKEIVLRLHPPGEEKGP